MRHLGFLFLALHLSFPAGGASAAPEAPETVVLVGAQGVDLPEEDGSLAFLPNGFEGKPCVRVGAAQRVNSKLCDVGTTGSTRLSWSWRKEGGKCCLIQLLLVNDLTGQSRWFGYCAGQWSEGASVDPTVEVFVADAPPAAWTKVERDLAADVRRVLGWEEARVVGLALSPWDAGTAWFAQVELANVIGPKSQAEARRRELRELILCGRQNPYQPPRMRRVRDRIVEFEYAFEECAPGRNAHVNTWGAFGAPWGPVQAMGRHLRVRYPLGDLVFLVEQGGRDVAPMALESLRMGLVRNRVPAVWARFASEGVQYQVTAMTVPDEGGAYDLYKLEMKNVSQETRAAGLVAGLDGPPDLKRERVPGVDAAWDALRAQGTVLALASPSEEGRLDLRDAGVCDRRALGYLDGPRPGGAEPAFASRRLGIDGVPVVYRAKAEPGKAYTVFLGGSTYGVPAAPGELVHRLVVEGAGEKPFDYASLQGQDRPMLVRFDGARDAGGDGCIEVRCEAAAGSKSRDTFLNVVYVFPEGMAGLDERDVWQGKLNAQAAHHIDVGATPEMSWAQDDYDLSDVGLARLRLAYRPRLAPGESAVRWLKVPPIHRREMLPYNIRHHAFARALPGEGIPPYGEEQVARLCRADPAQAERSVLQTWDRFFAEGAQIETPVDILNDLYYAQLGYMAVHLCRVSDQVAFVGCGPANYYDFAHRDHAYQVMALNLAGRHDLARQVTRHYCLPEKEIPDGPPSFAGRPLTLGQREDGLWFHRPGQWDAQGQSLWCLVEQWKLTGDRAWLKETLYPVVRRAAEWIIGARAKHKAQVKDPADPRYGLFPGGAMEVGAVPGEGEHLFYLSAWGVYGMQLAAEAAEAAGAKEDARRFRAEHADFRACLRRSYEKTFGREGLYQGALASSVETEHIGMAGLWTFTPLIFPCEVLAPHDPLMAATLRRMETYAGRYGSGLVSEGPGSFWPYISVDWGIGYIRRGEPDRALDVFCAYVDNAGPTMGWAEGYSSGANVGGGDEPHGWACAQYVSFLRHLLLMEEGDVLHVAPATPRWWLRGPRPVRVKDAPTHFGSVSYTLQPDLQRKRVVVDFTLRRHARPRQVVVHLRLPDGLAIRSATLNGRPVASFLPEAVLLSRPPDRFRLVAELAE